MSVGRIAAGVFVVLWATGFVGAKYGLPYAGPMTFLTIRFSLVASAHHSRANFDNTSAIEITGTIVDYAWRNPHVYMEIEGAAVLAEGAQDVRRTWLVEAHSVTGMRGNGWDGNSLAVGERVTLVGSPDHNPEKYFVLLDYVQKGDGTRLYAFGARGRETQVVEVPEIIPSLDFTGTWSLDFSRFNVREAGGGPPVDWNYTARGQAEAEGFNVHDNPELNCLEIGVPKVVIYPYGTNWSRDQDSIRIQKEHLNENRVIWLDPQAEGLQDQPPSYLGTSYGYFESERHLVVETSNFLPTIWGNANGVDSSVEKTVVEHYILAEDGLSMEISYSVDDPVYLAGPGIKTGGYLKAENREFEEIACDPSAASRHLSVEE